MRFSVKKNGTKVKQWIDPKNGEMLYLHKNEFPGVDINTLALRLRVKYGKDFWKLYQIVYTYERELSYVQRDEPL